MDIKNINGKISKRVIGAPKIVIKYGNKIFTLVFLKKDISSNTLKMMIKLKKIREISKNLLIKFLKIYFSYVLNIFYSLVEDYVEKNKNYNWYN